MSLKLRRYLLRFMGVVSGGMLLQSTCPLQENFDTITLFADVSSQFLTDAIFFALDTLLANGG